MLSKKDKLLMMRAIHLAKKAEGNTFPNPLVGCVLAKDGKVIAEGYHRKAGTPHAEIIALKKAKKKAEGADLYVNLEPCSHYGKTPPCVDSIIKSKIKKVYAAIKDPNPLVSGKGFSALKKEGIEVEWGFCKKEARSLNNEYIKFIKKSSK